MNKIRALRHIVLFFGIFISFQSLGLVTGVITADVKVRGAPNCAIVDSLKAGTIVGVLTVNGNWIRAMYLTGVDAKSAKIGWINSKYIRITSGAPGRGDCETEDKTGAEVCVDVAGASLDCDKGILGDSYSGCDVTIRYDLSTDYGGNASLDVDVECEAEIKYTGSGLVLPGDDSTTQNESHTLYAHDSDTGSMSLNFSFAPLSEVTRVKIDSASCRIDSVDLW